VRAIRRHAIRSLILVLLAGALVVTSVVSSGGRPVTQEPAGYGYGYGPPPVVPSPTSSTSTTTTSTTTTSTTAPPSQSNACASSNDGLFICRVYQDLLGRVPDASGVQTWTRILESATGGSSSKMPPTSTLALVVGDVQTSPTLEYWHDLLEVWYPLFLHRSPGASELSFWTNKLVGGASNEAVMADLAASDEAFGQASESNAVWLSNLYHELLGRPIDSTGLAHWSGMLSATADPAALNQRVAVALGVLSSNEYRTDLISADYHLLLDRAPDSTGLSTWLHLLATGGTDEQVIQQLLGSNEFWLLATT
jgi:hypothetical protein